jgi:hypothetical protein
VNPSDSEDLLVRLKDVFYVAHKAVNERAGTAFQAVINPARLWFLLDEDLQTGDW